MNYISFPGLGIEPFQLNKVAFSVFGRDIAWYGIIICTGIVLAVLYSMFRAKSEKIKTDDIIDLAFFLVLFGIIGARLYYVIFEYKNYFVTGEGFVGNLLGTLKNAVAVWEGGLAIYGAIIAGFLTILVYCKIKKIRLLKLVDVAAPAVMIGQIIGRWGNFVNVEAYGTETALPWRMGILTNLGDYGFIGEYVHPTFLYESLWNLVGFVIANLIYRKKKFDGQIFFFYIGWYGFGRMLIEGLRTDSLMIGDVIRVSQLIGALTFVAGVVFTIIFARIAKKKRILQLDGAVPAVTDEECAEGCNCEECAAAEDYEADAQTDAVDADSEAIEADETEE
ncbi:MAG: prolipoprotein diacylglyceryl transferase [Clostridia bacterium]|nr:prolipoprotein diacylglyceryl transferase [Clostridia bacterium]